MNLDLEYLGRSGVVESGSGSSLRFSPNLARPRVAFDAELKKALRFREAISALHEIVVGDLRFKPRDKSAYAAWKQNRSAEEAALRTALMTQAVAVETSALSHGLATEEPPENLDSEFRRLHGIYWHARRAWARELQRDDPELFRHLVPCDPVVTVAPDSVFFECFAKDQSSYGCLSVDREGFQPHEATLGTTNVDYSLALFEHFQTLRSYRPTRLLVDPSGFEVQVESREGHREEKIDLPPSWLRGFGQLQAAMALPTRTVELSVDAVYSLLAHLKRHREKTGPRSLRFQLTPGKPPSIVLEPWNLTVASRGPGYEGEQAEEIKVWGRRRLMVLSRVLPLAEKVTVQLLGSGLPSIWTVHMGELRLTLALSGWTANDWSAGANLAALGGNFTSDPRCLAQLSRHLLTAQLAPLSELTHVTEAPRNVVLGSLHQLARQGQVIYDFALQQYRWRQVMPVALSESVLGPEPEELVVGRRLAAEGAVKIVREEQLTLERRLVMAEVGALTCEAVLDLDGGLTRARCGCSYFRKFRLRGGRCRHLVALGLRAVPAVAAPVTKDWLH